MLSGPRRRPRTLDDAIISSQVLSRIADRQNRRGARGIRKAIVLAVCDEEGHVARLRGPGVPKSGVVLLADGRRDDASLNLDIAILRQSGFNVGGWGGIAGSVLIWLANEPYIVVLDATLHPWWRVESVARD